MDEIPSKTSLKNLISVRVSRLAFLFLTHPLTIHITDKRTAQCDDWALHCACRPNWPRQMRDHQSAACRAGTVRREL
jgi:hypothetical protein